jgi:hypothetical protein
MSRIGAGEVRYMPPQNNIYTILAAIAVVVQLVTILALFVKAGTVGGLF